MLTKIAVVFYLAVACMAVRAFVFARAHSAGARIPRWHVGLWMAISLLFALLAISRYFGIEEGLRIWMRSGLKVEGVYENRFSFQSVLTSIAIVAAALGAAGGVGLALKSGVFDRAGPSRTVATAGFASAAMVVLVILRLVSLHMIDALLFRGPHLNWIVDVGATIMVGVAAALYWRGPVPKRRR